MDVVKVVDPRIELSKHLGVNAVIEDNDATRMVLNAIMLKEMIFSASRFSPSSRLQPSETLVDAACISRAVLERKGFAKLDEFIHLL